MVTYFGFAVALLLPLYLVYRIWTVSLASISQWALHATVALGLIGLLLVVGRWDLAGGSYRYLFIAAVAGAITGSWLRVSDLPLFSNEGGDISWHGILDIVLVLALLTWTVAGLWPGRPAVNVTVPLHGENYYVAHGGGTYPINYHGLADASQRYAVDVTQLNDWGVRASGIYPEDLSQYAIYGDSVYSPLSGTVVRAVDRFSDQPPGTRRPNHPAGNHVWLRRGDAYVVLAHLKHGSVRVEPEETVRAGELIAAVGNTGNTSEPHLHIHAVQPTEHRQPVSDSVLANAAPVPLRFAGTFPIRNDVLPNRTPSGQRSTTVHSDPVPSADESVIPLW